ncbi:MAG: hypothetical protein H6981_11845 [Gammaproteobacteria bacterium]|nr:hypothetical protein [Gammaproteobacteria bacterium]MCP5137480.1 hypothetical protein [Gammaproteobacteria bacterium]
MAKLANRLAHMAAWPALLLAQAAFALGLGDVHQQSALNQPLAATIEIIAPNPEDMKGLSVNLADSAAFERAGIQRPGYLDDLRFAVVTPPSGAPYISISTKETFREPFVHFLVEVTSTKGRLRREYTLLLDPPSSLPKVAPTQSPSSVSRAAPQTRTPIAARPAASADGRPQMPLRAVQPALAPAARVPVAPPVRPVAPSNSAGTTYGPTGKQETLWGIASKLARDAGTTTQQMMLALLRSNPEAFYGDNINSMKTGVVLRVPSASDAQRLDKDEAIRAVRSQNADWQHIAGDVTRLDRLPTQAQVPPVSAPPAVPPEKSAVSVPETIGKLKIVGGDPATDTEVVAELERLVKEVALANETAESRRLENEDLRDRVGRLEQGIDKMQRLIELKDDEIASLQAGSRAANDPDADQAPDQDMSPETALDAPETPVEPELKPAPQVKPEALPAAKPKADAQPEAVKPKPINKIAKARIAPPPEPGLIDELLDDPLMMIGGSVLLALVLLLVLVRRRKAAVGVKEGEEKSEPLRQADAASDPDIKPEGKSRFGNFDLKALFARFGKKKASSGTGDAAIAAAVVGTAATVASASNGRDLRALGDEHFVAGRYSEAATQYAQAAHAAPGDFDLRSRLIEAHFKAKDAISFEREAEAFYADREGLEDAPWQNIVTMGSQLLPAHPLFVVGVPGPDTDVAETPTSESEDLVALDDLDLSDMDIEADFGSAMDGGATGSEPSAELDINSSDFDIGEVDFGDADGEDGNIDDLLQSGLDMESGIGLDDLDIGDDFSEDMTGTVGASPVAARETDEFPIVDDPTPARQDASTPAQKPHADLDFEIDADLQEKLSSAPAPSDTADDDEQGMVFDLSGFEIDEGDDGEIDLGEFDVPDNGATELDMHLDALGDDIDMLGDMPATGSGNETGLEEIDLGADFAGSGGGMAAEPDEVDTKLDLARAYIDMGDPDGARVMLEEVVAEGNDGQRQEAQSLIDQMA